MNRISLTLLMVVVAITVAQASPARSDATDALHAAVTRAVKFLTTEVPAWKVGNGCFSCHNNGDGARALFAAQRLGFTVPDAALTETVEWVTNPAGWDQNQGDPGVSDARLADLQFAASLRAANDAGWVRDPAPLALAARRVARGQDASGAWPVEPANPIGSPATYGTALATLSALRTLEAADLSEHHAAIARAREWFAQQPVVDVPAAATAILFGRGMGQIPEAALETLRSGQTGDGGWGPFRHSPPEAFDTALALLALAGLPDRPAVEKQVQRGAAFLLAAQNPDGSWPATTRPPRGQSYAQQVSTTAWATLALLAVETPPRPGVLTLFAGTGETGSGGDGGPALRATLDNPFGLVRGPDGALWWADYEAHVVRRIARDGTISTVVGNGRAAYAGDGGPALAASLNHPHELRFDRAGNLFIADTSNHAIRRYDPKTKVLTTFVGTGVPGYGGDGGPATSATLKLPISLQFDPIGDLFIADIGNHVIRRVDTKTGVITTFAGTGKAGATPEGSPITGTPLNGPRSLDFDAAGDLWLVTREGNQVLRFDRTRQVIRHEAGTGGKGYTGDGGPARQATLNGPKGIAVAPDGRVLLADTENHVIRRIDSRRGSIETLAGTGTQGTALEANPRATQLNRPHGVYVDVDGTVFIGDSENHRILTISR